MKTITQNNYANLKALVLFAAATLILGMLTAWFSFKFFPITQTYKLPVLYPPKWMFWVVWLILYPCMGIAAGLVWLQRTKYDVRGAMAFYCSIILGNFLFLPISNLSNGNPAIMTLMDINGVFSSILFGWLCAKYSDTAFKWLLPLIVWMPVTAGLKIMLWLANS